MVKINTKFIATSDNYRRGNFPEAAYLIITKDGQRVQSDNWASFEIAKGSIPSKNGQCQSEIWD